VVLLFWFCCCCWFCFCFFFCFLAFFTFTFISSYKTILKWFMYTHVCIYFYCVVTVQVTNSNFPNVCLFVMVLNQFLRLFLSYT
jgi:hypothetical protein